MIGGLQYQTRTRLDIKNAIRIVVRFQDYPKAYHYATIKRIFRYLKGASDYGIGYDKLSDFTLVGYNDVDWVGSMDYRKSTSGIEFFLGGRLVSWLSKK